MEKANIYITEEEIKALLNWKDTFEATEIAIKSVSAGKAVLGERTFSHIFNTPKHILTMPGYLEDEKYGSWACKLLRVNSENAKRPQPLPHVYVTIVLMDEDTGAFKAVLDGLEITNWRTAAASAVATKYLHTPTGKPQKILSIFGCGDEGKSHAECFHHFFNFEEVRLWNRTTQRATNLAKELNEKFNTRKFKVFEDRESCAKDADVIITATNPGSSSILKYEWLKQGVHINAVGVPVKNAEFELEEKIYKHAHVYVDNWDGANRELKKLKNYGADMKAEVGEVILGKVAIPSKGQLTIFQSLGMAVEDCAMARMIYDLYNKKKATTPKL